MDDPMLRDVPDGGEGALKDARKLCRREARQPWSQGTPLDVLHCQIWRVLPLEYVADPDHVWVRQATCHACRSDESLPGRGVETGLPSELLEGHNLPRVGVAGLVDDRHASA